MMIEGVPGSTARDQSRAKADMMKELKHYGLHRHFTGGSCVLMFGGGIKRGFLYGETADERPCIVDEEPDQRSPTCTPRSARPWASRRRRPSTSRSGPFYATQDGKGQPVMDLFA